MSTRSAVCPYCYCYYYYYYYYYDTMMCWMQVGCLRANTVAHASTFPARSGVTASLATLETGARLTLMSVHRIHVRIRAPVLTTADASRASVWTVRNTRRFKIKSKVYLIFNLMTRNDTSKQTKSKQKENEFLNLLVHPRKVSRGIEFLTLLAASLFRRHGSRLSSVAPNSHIHIPVAADHKVCKGLRNIRGIY